MRTYFLALPVALVVAGQGAALASNPEVEAKLAAGVWRSLVTGGTNVYDWPLTPGGRQRFENFRLEEDPSLRCEPPGMPRSFYHLSPMQFAFDGDVLTVRHETMDVVRLVYMDRPAPPADQPHTPNGYSIGRWDDDVLIVDTTHLAAGETVREGVPKSAAMTLHETYSVQEREAPHLVVTVTISDPENFTEPFTTSNEFVLEPDWDLLPFDCQPTEY